MFWLDGVPRLYLFDMPLQPAWLLTTVMAIYLVWLVNLYNFMDGIDGIAGVEAISVAVAGIVLQLLIDAPESAWLPPALLAAASAGFLVWNFPRARIFMGDAGSGFLGLMLGALSLLAAARSRRGSARRPRPHLPAWR